MDAPEWFGSRHFEACYCADKAEALEKVKKGLIDMVCSVTGDYLWDERNKPLK